MTPCGLVGVYGRFGGTIASIPGVKRVGVTLSLLFSTEVEAARCYSGTSIDFCLPRRRMLPEVRILHTHRHEHLKSVIKTELFLRLIKRHTMKTYMGVEAKLHAYLISELWWGVVSFMSRNLSLRGRSPRYSLNRGMGGTLIRSRRRKNSLDTVGIRIPVPQSCNAYAYRLSYLEYSNITYLRKLSMTLERMYPRLWRSLTVTSLIISTLGF